MLAQNPNEPNNAVEIYYQVGPDDTRTRILIDLLTQIMYEPLFDQVRTKEQFGYSVSTGSRWTGGIMGVAFKIVTSVKTVEECLDRLARFVREYRQELSNMKQDTYMSNVVSLAKGKLQAWNSLGEHTAHLWGELTCNRHQPECLREEVMALRSITKEDLVAFYDKHLVEGGPDVRKVSVAVLGGEGPGLGGGSVQGGEVIGTLDGLDQHIAAVGAKGKWPVVYKV